MMKEYKEWMCGYLKGYALGTVCLLPTVAIMKLLVDVIQNKIIDKK